MSKVTKDLSQTKMSTAIPTAGRRTAVTLEERVGEVSASVQQAHDDGVFAAGMLGVFQYRDGNSFEYLKPVGHYTYDSDSPEVTDRSLFDIASVTKSIPTMLLILLKLNKGEIFLDQLVSDRVGDLKGDYASKVTIRHLLTYGIELNVELGTGFGLQKVEALKALGLEEIHKRIMQSGLKRPPGPFSYRNTTSYIATKLVERLYGMSYYEAADKYVLKPMGVEGGFLSGRLDPERFVPTEIQSGRMLQGVVHDEFSRALDSFGVASGASGMFLSGQDGLRICRAMVGGLSDRLLPEREDRFPLGFSRLIRQNHLSGQDPNHRYGLGWDILDPDYPPCGCKHKETILITGSTGCVMMFQPGLGTAYFLFTNSIFPQRRILPPEEKSPMFHLRQRIHKTLVCECSA